jgi:Arc/MetJ-type ribon-helix-helix transcriptional regulator
MNPMQLRLTKPELAKFVDEKVQAGEFPSADAVIEDAVTRMMEDERTLTEEDARAITEADAEIDRGEFVDFDAFAADMRAKFPPK